VCDLVEVACSYRRPRALAERECDDHPRFDAVNRHEETCPRRPVIVGRAEEEEEEEEQQQEEEEQEEQEMQEEEEQGPGRPRSPRRSQRGLPGAAVVFDARPSSQREATIDGNIERNEQRKKEKKQRQRDEKKAAAAAAEYGRPPPPRYVL
jgi:hypothetical protein